ncbi:MAG: hypothetical protein U1E65_06035 [Myxococcota bacterium]
MRSAFGAPTVLLFALAVGAAGPASAVPCAICNATTACSDPSEICVSGIPENDGMTGRCVTPCPNPTAAFGGCPTNYSCIPLGSGDTACLPRSDTCANVTGYTPTFLGQACTTNSCDSHQLCIGGVCQVWCIGNGDQGTCSSGQICGDLVGSDIGACGPPLSEGTACGNPSLSCTDGICIDSGSGAVCLSHCHNNTCSNGETCTTFNFQGGQMAQACSPPGGVPDAGTTPDAGFIFPDASTPPPPDAGFPDSGSVFADATEIPDFGFVFPDAAEGSDAGNVNNNDAGTSMNDGGNNPEVDGGSGDGGSGSADAHSSNNNGHTGGGSTVRRGGGCSAFGDLGDGLWMLAPGLGFLALRRRRAH